VFCSLFSSPLLLHVAKKALLMSACLTVPCFIRKTTLRETTCVWQYIITLYTLHTTNSHCTNAVYFNCTVASWWHCASMVNFLHLHIPQWNPNHEFPLALWYSLLPWVTSVHNNPVSLTPLQDCTIHATMCSRTLCQPTAVPTASLRAGPRIVILTNKQKIKKKTKKKFKIFFLVSIWAQPDSLLLEWRWLVSMFRFLCIFCQWEWI